VRPGERQAALDVLLPEFHDLWHPQPFRLHRPDWCEQWPALSAELLALDDAAVAHLANDADAALALLCRHLPALGAIQPLIDFPALPKARLVDQDARWAWEIPGRKQQQIEAFAAVARSCDRSVIDWCGGKGHLGRLLALQWQLPVHTLELDQALCTEGEHLANRLRLRQTFSASDALLTDAWPQAGQHAVALHACGELHRRLIRRGSDIGVQRFDIAPCCYHRGVGESYQALSGALQLHLTRDDMRLAVTETVTASPRLTRQRDHEMAWKLGFDAYRREHLPTGYKTFKPVPSAWFTSSFPEFLQRMASREGLPSPDGSVATWERRGWQRQREVLRLSIVRQAFRRAIEVWLVLDLAVYLEKQGYSVSLGYFCERRLTPRNLLISAQRS
jgi:hypothetical protein